MNWLTTIILRRRNCREWIFQRDSNGFCTRRDSDVADRCCTVDQLVDGLEVRFLANRGEPVLDSTDFEDASGEVLPGDEELLRLIQAKPTT